MFSLYIWYYTEEKTVVIDNDRIACHQEELIRFSKGEIVMYSALKVRDTTGSTFVAVIDRE